MPETTALMASFYGELEKEAFIPARVAQLGTRIVRSPQLLRGLGGFGAGAGAGGLVGAGAGAALQGARSYQKAREMGATGGQAAGMGLSGALSGAAKGALLGAGAGGLGLGGMAALGKAPGMTRRLIRMEGPVGAGARFGQRQVHALTGWTPKGGLREIGIGAPHVERLAKAHKGLWEAQAGEAPIGMARRVAGRAMGRTPEQMQAGAVLRAEKELAKARRASRLGERAEAMGLTSLPGYARSLARQPIETLRTGFGSQWAEMGPVGRTLMFGYPAAAVGKELMTPTEEGGRGKLERAGRHMGELGFTMGPLPIAGMLAAAPIISGTAGTAGKLLGKAKPKPTKPPPAPPSLEPAGGEVAPAEYVFSDRMAGQGGFI